MGTDALITLRAFASSLWRNPLLLLIGAQALYVLIGKIFLEFDLSWLEIALAAGVAAAAEVAFKNLEAYAQKSPRPGLFFPGSALAAGLGIAIFFRASHPLFFALASLIAIGSKYALQLHGKHVFNPSNIAIVALIFLLPSYTTVELTQWGSDPRVFAGVAALSLWIAYRAGVLLTSLTFLASYAALLIPLVSWAPGTFSGHHYGLIGPSLILFASFMITDPQTSPKGTVGRILHGISVALLYFTLEAWGVQYSIFAASFGITVLNAAWRIAEPRLAWRSIAPNAASSALVLLVALFSAYQFFSAHGAHLSTFRVPGLSAQFLLLGIESPALYQCSGDSLLVPKGDSGLTGPANTPAAAWGDYDGDGFTDFFLSRRDGLASLYRNNRDGTFADATRAAGIPPLAAKSGFFAEYDGDGLADLFVIELREGQRPTKRFAEYDMSSSNVRIFRNLGGGAFAEATAGSGLDSAPAFDSASFGDYDNDGDLDLLMTAQGARFPLFLEYDTALGKTVANPSTQKRQWLTCHPDALRDIALRNAAAAEGFAAGGGLEAFISRHGCVVLSSTIDLSRTRTDHPPLPQLEGIVGGTTYLPGYARLYENLGGRYREAPAFRAIVDGEAMRREAMRFVGLKEGEHPFDVLSGTIFQAVSFDYDGDALLDVFLAADTGSNLLVKNRGGLRFENVTASAGVNYSGSGMGADVADVNRDGWFDVVVSNTLRDFLFVNNGDGTFANVATEDFGAIGIGWGIAFLDYDLDGWEDVYIANGDMLGLFGELDEELGQPLFRLDNLYRNEGTGFSDSTGGTICSENRSGKSLAMTDYDNDGDTDIFVGNLTLPSRSDSEDVLYENKAAERGGSYLRVALEGTRANPTGVGAVVEVRYGQERQFKTVTLGASYHSQHSSTLTFGLGPHRSAVDVSVRWPSGERTEYAGAMPGTTITMRP